MYDKLTSLNNQMYKSFPAASCSYWFFIIRYAPATAATAPAAPSAAVVITMFPSGERSLDAFGFATAAAGRFRAFTAFLRTPIVFIAFSAFIAFRVFIAFFDFFIGAMA
eukprot:TRINITY_DN88794_c0_g1_i1.p1 TRINITY_DN88794_c0_g1~~TRINITY_DN88794_c0_g1_i1.p1  ORF type:complete len:109 (-),score=13.89 TRINITY_DN88794_c0_g1_i1:79-405(-)